LEFWEFSLYSIYIFDRLYRQISFFIFAQKFGTSTNPMLGNIHEIYIFKMLEKIQAILEILACLGKL